MPTLTEQLDDIQTVSKAFRQYQAKITAAENLVKNDNASSQELRDAVAALEATPLDKVIRDLISDGKIEGLSLFPNVSADSSVNLLIDSLQKVKTLLQRETEDACGRLRERIGVLDRSEAIGEDFVFQGHQYIASRSIEEHMEQFNADLEQAVRTTDQGINPPSRSIRR